MTDTTDLRPPDLRAYEDALGTNLSREERAACFAALAERLAAQREQRAAQTEQTPEASVTG
jgi:hypothetical protein